MTEKIKNIAEVIKPKLIEIRRHLHMNPELGYEEYETAAYICSQLDEIGVSYKAGVGVTGVLATIEGHQDGPTVLLRSDMDALSMMELNECDYKSQNTGKMHACGHDGHVTWLLGAAMILNELQSELKGTVKLIFQPAEEGEGGAVKVIEDGVMDKPKVDAVMGAHIWPGIEAGSIGVKYKGAMAAPTFFKLRIKGKGGHGAEPHNTIDPIAIGCQVYSGLQTIISRMSNPTEPVVLSVTQFHSGTAHNVIPDEAELSGTVRTFTDEMVNHVERKMRAMIQGIVEAHGADYEFEYNTYYPPVINDDAMVDHLKSSAAKVVGEDKVKVLSDPSMAGEDFSFYLKEAPGVFFFVGNRNEGKGITKPLHSPYFNIDEDVLGIASAVMAQAAVDYLNQN